MPFVYIVECADGTLYTGWAIDVDRRVAAHNAGRASRYTRSRRPVKLVYVEKRVSPLRPAPSIEQAEASGQLILLAEDNETNREVMQEQLRLLGYACEVAEDGLIGLEKWRSGRYALLLTDCHMPNMDGFELTAAVRQDDHAQGRHSPIIAVTANAMQGEAEHCIEHGMDDYLSKPLRLNELGPMLAKWLPLEDSAAGVATVEAPAKAATAEPPSVMEAVPPAPTSDDDVWDATVLTRMVGDNPAMHRRFLEKFLSGAADQVDRIVAAAASNDAATVAKVAHALKSAARTVGALPLGELCEQMELAGKAGDTAQCRALSERLTGSFAAAAERIKRHLSPAS